MPNQSSQSNGITRFHSTVAIGSALIALTSLAAGVWLYVAGYAVSKGGDINIPVNLNTFREIDGSASGVLAIQNPLNEDLFCRSVHLNVTTVTTPFNVDIGIAANATTSGVTLADNLNITAAKMYTLSGTSLRQTGNYPQAFVLNGSGGTNDFITMFTRAGVGAINGSGSVICNRFR